MLLIPRFVMAPGRYYISVSSIGLRACVYVEVVDDAAVRVCDQDEPKGC
jgi:hypothetical protein